MTRRFLLPVVALLPPTLFIGIVLASSKATTPASSVGPTPSVVTLQANKKRLTEVLRQLSKKTGNRLDEREPIPGTTVSVDVHKASFWQALDALAAASNTQADPYHRSGLLRLTKRSSDRAPPASYDGFFRSMLKKVTAARDLEAGASHYTAQLEVAWEPRLEPLFLETHPRDAVLKDDQGKALVFPTEGSVAVPVDGKLALTFDVRLPALPRSAAKIGLFSGKLTAIAPSAMVTFSFDTLQQLANANAGSPQRRRTEHRMACTLTRVDLLSERTTIQVKLDLPPGGLSLESNQSWVVNNEMWLERKKDKAKRQPRDYSIDSYSTRTALLSYTFTQRDVLAQPGEWAVFYRTPAGLVELPFSFSFKDVPLP